MGALSSKTITGGSSGLDTLAAWIDIVCRWLIIVVFLAAAIPKIISPIAFSEIIGAYGLLPEFLLFPMAIFMPWAELLTAIGMMFKKQWAIISALLLMLVFIAVLSCGVYLGLDIDCGCFGPDDPEHKAFSGLRTALIRDIVLLVPLLFSVGYHFYTKHLPGEKK